MFGEAHEPLLGLYHPPAGSSPRRHGVVLLNPFGQEYLRAHRTLRQLAERLAQSGFHTLRFDYFGCGDSAGEDHEVRLSRGLDDVEAAVEELEELSGSPRPILVGLRLGAVLALRFASRSPAVEALVLWDPVRDGRGYLEELTAVHQVWMREHARKRQPPAPGPPEELLGFPLPEALRREIESVDLTGHRSSPARKTLVLAPEQDPPLFPDGPPQDGTLDRLRPAGAPPWRFGGDDGMESSLVPVEALEQVAGWLEAQCR